jgi:hypothetical protein
MPPNGSGVKTAGAGSAGAQMGLTLINRLCDVCKYRHHGTHPATCDAFPQRIPVDIRLMYADHRLAYPGDNGIRFEPVDETPATTAKLARVTLRM